MFPRGARPNAQRRKKKLALRAAWSEPANPRSLSRITSALPVTYPEAAPFTQRRWSRASGLPWKTWVEGSGRSLATLTSVGLTDKVRAIIEQGPPEELVATFHQLFDGKIKETKALAAEAAKRYGLLPGLIE